MIVFKRSIRVFGPGHGEFVLIRIPLDYEGKNAVDVDVDGFNSFRTVQLTNNKQKLFNPLNLKA